MAARGDRPVSRRIHAHDVTQYRLSVRSDLDGLCSLVLIATVSSVRRTDVAVQFVPQAMNAERNRRIHRHRIGRNTIARLRIVIENPEKSDRAALAQPLQRKLTHQKKLRKLERRRYAKRRERFGTQGTIEKQREVLIGQAEERLGHANIAPRSFLARRR